MGKGLIAAGKIAQSSLQQLGQLTAYCKIIREGEGKQVIFCQGHIETGNRVIGEQRNRQHGGQATKNSRNCYYCNTGYVYTQRTRKKWMTQLNETANVL